MPQRLGQRLADSLVGHDDVSRHAFEHVPALHFHLERLVERRGRSDLELDLLGGALADEQVVVPRMCWMIASSMRVAGDAQRTAVDDAGQRDDGDVGGAAADVDDHVAGGSVIGRPAPIAAAIGSSTRCTSLALARKPLSFTARRSTWVISGGTPMTTPRPDQRPLAVRLADEVGEHLLGGVEVGDDAVAHRPDRP